jgi:hypothetical protein
VSCDRTARDPLENLVAQIHEDVATMASTECTEKYDALLDQP